jgi:hypothetical protein
VTPVSPRLRLIFFGKIDKLRTIDNAVSTFQVQGGADS